MTTDLTVSPAWLRARSWLVARSDTTCRARTVSAVSTQVAICPAPAGAVPFTGPGSWAAADVAGYLAAGVRPALMRDVIAAYPHPGDYEAQMRRHRTAMTSQGWPAPAPPLEAPRGTWMELIGTPGYPQHLCQVPAPPLVLFGAGDPAVLATPGLGVVGTRDATAYGAAVATTATEAVPHPHPVVSGLAVGVDTIAHTRALELGTPTIAVIATGPDQPYPSVNVPLARQIVTNGGAVVSEQPFGTGTDTAPARTPAPLTGRLMARNRIIAGLSAALVLAEAAGRSGSMHTVWATLGLGRVLIVAPPKPHARTLPGAQAPTVLADTTRRTEAQLVSMGAPKQVATKLAGRVPLANAVAADRQDLTTLVRLALALHKPT